MKCIRHDRYMESLPWGENFTWQVVALDAGLSGSTADRLGGGCCAARVADVGRRAYGEGLVGATDGRRRRLRTSC